jgi:L-phenylalanine/L-methionine N-acetyltransferase
MPKPPPGLIIRPVSVADAAQLHTLFTLPGVVWGTNQLPSQTVDAVRERIEGRSTSRDTHSLVAELEGKLVGSAGLQLGHNKRRLTASLGIMVHDDYVGQGVGRALIEALLHLADNYLGLNRIELDVMVDNAAAIHLYESLGFEREGIMRAAIFRGGVFVDLLMMGRVKTVGSG